MLNANSGSNFPHTSVFIHHIKTCVNSYSLRPRIKRKQWYNSFLGPPAEIL